MTHEVMRSRTLSILWHICERGNGSRERKHRMQEQHQPTGRYKLCIARPVSSPTHPGAPCSRHTHRSARSCWQQTHTLQARLRQQPSTHRAHLPKEAFGSKSLTHAGHAFGSSLTHLTPLSSSLTRARAIPSNRWSSRRAFTAGGSLQAHGVMREAGTRARAHAHVPSCTASHRARAFTRRPLNVF